MLGWATFPWSLGTGTAAASPSGKRNLVLDGVCMYFGTLPGAARCCPFKSVFPGINDASLLLSGICVCIRICICFKTIRPGAAHGKPPAQAGVLLVGLV